MSLRSIVTIRKMWINGANSMTGDILRSSITIDPAPTRKKNVKRGKNRRADEPPKLASFRRVEPVKGFILAGNFLGRSRRDTTEWLLKILTRGRGRADVIKHTPHDVFLSPLVPASKEPSSLCVTVGSYASRGSIWISIFSKRLRSIDRRLSPGRGSSRRSGFVASLKHIYMYIHTHVYFERYSYYIDRFLDECAKFGKFELQNIWRVR